MLLHKLYINHCGHFHAIFKPIWRMYENLPNSSAPLAFWKTKICFWPKERFQDLKIGLNCSQMHSATTYEATYSLECLGTSEGFYEIRLLSRFSKFMLFSALTKHFAAYCRVSPHPPVLHNPLLFHSSSAQYSFNCINTAVILFSFRFQFVTALKFSESSLDSTLQKWSLRLQLSYWALLSPTI